MAPMPRPRRHRSDPDPAAARVGARIRQLREGAGFTFDAFVEELGLGRGYVSELERGLVVPSLTALTRIAQALDLTVADVVLGTTLRERVFDRSRGLDGADVERLLARVDAMVQARREWRIRAAAHAERIPFRTVSERGAKKLATALPLLSIRPSAGHWSAPQIDAVETFVVVPLRALSKRNVFVARVTGSSMEPTVADGSYSLFSRPWTSRAGEIGIFARHDAQGLGSFCIREFVHRPHEGRSRSHEPAEVPYARWLRMLTPRVKE